MSGKQRKLTRALQEHGSWQLRVRFGITKLLTALPAHPVPNLIQNLLLLVLATRSLWDLDLELPAVSKGNLLGGSCAPEGRLISSEVFLRGMREDSVFGAPIVNNTIHILCEDLGDFDLNAFHVFDRKICGHVHALQVTKQVVIGELELLLRRS